MGTERQLGIAGLHLVGLEDLRKRWGWFLALGILLVLLSMAIWRQWPLSGLWIIGLFVGIDMLLNGWSLVMLGLAAKKLPTSEQPA